MYNDLKKFLLSDYELVDRKNYNLKQSVAIGIALTAYVFFFDPYENFAYPVRYGIPIRLIQLGYGINASVTIYLLYWIIFNKIGFGGKKRSWKTYQHLLLVMFIVIFIGCTGLIYHRIFTDVGEVAVSYVLLVTAPRTILIATSLAIISFLIARLHTKNKYTKNSIKPDSEGALKQPTAHTSEICMIRLKSPIIDQVLELDPQHVLYFRSYGNYVKVRLQGHTNDILFRAPLHYVAQELKDFSFIVRCHRQYYVNINQIDKLIKPKGEIRRAQLILEGGTDKIPVSKSYNSFFFKILK